MRKVFNYAAGPSMLPEEVLLEIRRELLDCGGSGMFVGEMSHRGKEFKAIHEEALALMRELLSVPDDYLTLFLQGGASTQFSAVPLNLLTDASGRKADYVVTGNFAEKAYKEALRYGDIRLAASSADGNYSYIPDLCASDVRPDADYAHITYNNTVYGTRYSAPPDIPNLVSDASSMFLSEPMDVTKFKLIYAGAQKNLAPPGLTAVIVRKDAVFGAEPLPFCPTMLKYSTQAAANSLYNTPCTFSIYVAMLNMRWLKKFGGLKKIEEFNIRKSRILYDIIDDSSFYRGLARPKDRSRMNVVFVTPSPELDSRFAREAEANGMVALRGHRALGGIRASVYNAMPIEGVEKLAEFMKRFELENR